MQQTYIKSGKNMEWFQDIVRRNFVERVLVVCGHSAEQLVIFQILMQEIKQLGIAAFLFQEFMPNPDYTSVVAGIRCFNQNSCNMIIAIGGGSAIDVAKCIKLGCMIEKGNSEICQTYRVAKVPFLAVPTTAGAGSEATQFAVIYFNFEKVSICHPDGLPDYVILDGKALMTLPIVQRKVTVLDALSHGIESMWSVHSTKKSREYASAAIKQIVANMDAYIEKNGAEMEMLLAANYAGRAINITKTTAAHAMCYKLTSMYHLPHGQAVMTCLPELWEYMAVHMDKCVDGRGGHFLEQQFENIAECLGQPSLEEAIFFLKQIRNKWNVKYSYALSEQELELLTCSVNADRLNNNPVLLDREAIYSIYQKSIRGDNNEC